MVNITINAKHADLRVSFGNTGAKALKDLTDSEKLDYAILARQNGKPAMVNRFDALPTMAELLAEKTTGEIAAIKANSPAPTFVPPAKPTTTPDAKALPVQGDSSATTTK
jgi:hypothetical protein